MAFIRNLILALAGILLMVNCVQINAGILQGTIDDIKDSIDAVTCPAKYTNAYDTCTNIFLPFYIAFEKNSLKKECCAQLAQIDCTSAVASVMCGRGAEIATRTVSGIGYFTSARCAQFHSIEQCTNLVGLLFSLVIVILIIVFMFMCCCNIFCGSIRRK